ncbi:hypothetical protein E2C01_035357 [Portunus trituberculatus]|uniref:Uncharacterized protein n=1 Tax=Portunus trituberculatus TaxID=210409 RepID=A0A5B7F9J1_PORTR|nr:hypothetical protein [Portunus trituberculatus]
MPMLSNLPSFPPHSLTKFICAVYLFPNSSDYSKFFDYLTSKVEHILSLYLFVEISIGGDFIVHHQLWLSSPFTDHPGELAFNFAILHDLEQLVQHTTCISDRLGDTPNILDLFLPVILLLMLLPYLLYWAPLITISFLYFVLFLQSFLRIPQSGAASGVFASASWGDLRRYCADFPWNGYCFHVRDPSLHAKHITDVIVSGMEVYIPHSFSQHKLLKPWFNTACSCATHNREVAHKRNLTLPSPEFHALYITAWNHAKSVLQFAKHSFINRKCQNFSNSNSPRDLWHLA